MSNETHYPAHHGLLHVSLGAMRREYMPLFMQAANDIRVTRGMLMRPPVTLEAEYAWYDNVIAKRSETDQLFAILKHEGDGEDRTYRYLGHTGLHRISWPSAFAVSGSVIIDAKTHGKGYGTEAKLLLLYHAFRVKGLRKVVSEVKAFNAMSWGHLLRCGYKPVGRYKKHHFNDGEYIDEVILEVFRDEWELIWEAYQRTNELPKLTDEQRTLIGKG